LDSRTHHEHYYPWFLFVPNNLLKVKFSSFNIYYRRSVDSYLVFNTLIALTSVSQWHYLICIIDEITDILGIRVFRVKPKQENKPLIVSNTNVAK
jgi:hypothetical protein